MADLTTESVAEGVWRVLAPNPGPMTLDGTNTWLVGRSGAGELAVIDPGPDDATHLTALLALAGQCRARITAVLLTHRHADHDGGTAALLAATGARDLTPPPGDHPTTLDVAGVRLKLLPTPGHTTDSVCLQLENLIFTGDTVLGRGTSVVAHPDGTVADYLRSLALLEAEIAGAGITRLLPGHGPAVDDPAAAVSLLRRHRLARLAEVAAVREAGALTPGEIVARIYPRLDGVLRVAAERTVAACLHHLETHGDARDTRGDTRRDT